MAILSQECLELAQSVRQAMIALRTLVNGNQESLAGLATTDKTSLVAALNEVKATAAEVDLSGYATTAELTAALAALPDPPDLSALMPKSGGTFTGGVSMSGQTLNLDGGTLSGGSIGFDFSGATSANLFSAIFATATTLTMGAGMGDALWTAMGGGGTVASPSFGTVKADAFINSAAAAVDVPGTTFLITNDHNGKVLVLKNAADCILTLNAGLDPAFSFSVARPAASGKGTVTGTATVVGKTPVTGAGPSHLNFSNLGQPANTYYCQ